MFISHFTRLFTHCPEIQMGVIFHHEGEILTQVTSDLHPSTSLLQFKEIFQELGHTFPLIGGFRGGFFETESSLWLIYPLSSSLKIGMAVQKGTVVNQARFWLNELISQINQSL